MENRDRMEKLRTSVREEQERLQALYRLQLFETGAEEAFDRITGLVRDVLRVPICLFSLVGEDTQWFKSCIGLPRPLEEARSTSRDVSFCKYVVASGEMVVVPDATKDARFIDNDLVRDYHVRAYAGAPVFTTDGHVLGTLCVIDVEPREFPERELQLLDSFSKWVMTEVELREHGLRLERELDLARTVQEGMLGKSYRDKRIAMHAANLPFHKLGGDMYGWNAIGDGQYGLYLLDVVGHGLSSSLIAVSAGALLRDRMRESPEPGEVAARLNRHMHELNEVGTRQYFTLLYLMIDLNAGRLSYINAGHPAGLLLQADGSLRQLHSTCPPAGMLQPGAYAVEVRELPLDGLYRLLLYTDGLLATDRPYSEQAAELGSRLQARHTEPIERLPHLFLKDVPSSRKERDDVSIVAVELCPGPATASPIGA